MGLSRYASRLASSAKFASSPVKPSSEAPRIEENPPRSKAPFGLLSSGIFSNLHEPEDARLTGGTRSLARRLLGLNLPSVSMQIPTASSAASSDAARRKGTKKSKVAFSKPVGTA